MKALSDIGLVGLAVMGENLVLNMESKGFQNRVRLGELEERIKLLLGQAQLIINAADVDVSGTDGQNR